jgi:hypothetical protein
MLAGLFQDTKIKEKNLKKQLTLTSPQPTLKKKKRLCGVHRS